jgi:hypothetical protein
VRAHNAHGWGEESDITVIVAAQSPETPDPPSSTVHNHFVKISWTAPYENSAPIIGYRIYVSDANGEFLQETTYCDAEREPVFSQLYCEIPMANLHLEPYSLQFGDEVLVKVQASNTYGDSGISDVSSSNAKIQTVPEQVQNLSELATTTSDNIDFEWDALTTEEQTGGSEILSYQVQWDRGSDGSYFLNLAGYVA